ncbi:MAG: hypothetical protein Q7S31_00625 [bacterium]|nr:hypothetical protein [bacterium]
MRLVLALTFSVILLFQAAATPVWAAPAASLRTDTLRRYVFLTFTGLPEVSRISYTLMYDSNGITRGFEGGFRPKSKINRSTRRQILGTCSSARCVFHKNPKKFQLEVVFTLRSGETSTVTKNLQ